MVVEIFIFLFIAGIFWKVSKHMKEHFEEQFEDEQRTEERKTS